MKYETLAVGLRRVELGIGFGWQTEDLPALSAEPESERVVDGVAGLVAQDTHAPFVLSALDFEHLGFFQLRQARVGEVEGDGNRRRAVGGEPFIREIEVERELKTALLELAAELRDAVRKRTLDRQRKLRQAKVQECLVI